LALETQNYTIGLIKKEPQMLRKCKCVKGKSNQFIDKTGKHSDGFLLPVSEILMSLILITVIQVISATETVL